MNSLNQIIRHLIIKAYGRLKAIFVCPVFNYVGSNGMMYMGGENEAEAADGEKCQGCEDGKECECGG